MTDRVTPILSQPASPRYRLDDIARFAGNVAHTLPSVAAIIAPVGTPIPAGQLGVMKPATSKPTLRFTGFDVMRDLPGPIEIGGHASNPYLDEVDKWRKLLWDVATKPRPELKAVGIEHGYLDPGDVAFLMVSMEELVKICARGGFPERFHHWKWGQALVQEYADEKSGRSRTFEIVTATKPVSKAYLSENNVVGEQALVMAHVFAHTDFFKNNRYYKHMDPYIEAAFKENKTVIEGYRKNHEIRRASKTLTGEKNPVDEFMDKLFSVEELIDFSHNFALSGMPEMKYTDADRVDTLDVEAAVRFPHADRQLQQFLYPDEDRAAEVDATYKRRLDESKKLPARPTRDILGFLATHSRALEPWQKDILERFRHEAYYFVPIVRTGVIDEGWTTTWERRLVMGSPETAKEALPLLSYLVDSNKNQLLRFSIYSLGYYIWQDVREKAGRGLLNVNWDDVKTQEEHDRLMARPYDDAVALKEMYRIRRDYDDIRFIQEYFNRDVVKKARHIFEPMGLLPETPDDMATVWTHKGPTTIHIPGLSTPEEKAEAREVTEVQARFIKRQLVNMFTNSGQPIIALKDANYNDKEETCSSGLVTPINCISPMMISGWDHWTRKRPNRCCGFCIPFGRNPSTLKPLTPPPKWKTNTPLTCWLNSSVNR